MEEIWKPYPECPKYQVSNLGRVKGPYGKVLAAPENQWGYRGVTLVDRKVYSRGQVERRVHRMVLETFVGPRPDGMDATHLDGDKLNNQADNLSWRSRSDNIKDQVAHGTHRNSSKTHCPRGHQLVEPNLIDGHLKRGIRNCKSCSRARSRASSLRRKQNILLTESEINALADKQFSRLMSSGVIT